MAVATALWNCTMLRLTSVRELKVTEEYVAYSKAAIEAAIATPNTKKAKKAPLPPGIDRAAVDHLLHTLNLGFATSAWMDYLGMAEELEGIEQTDEFFPVRKLVCHAMLASTNGELESTFSELVAITEKSPEKTDAWLGMAHIKCLAYQFKDAERLLQLAELAPTPNVATISTIRQRNAFGLKYCTQTLIIRILCGYINGCLLTSATYLVPHSYYFLGYFFWGVRFLAYFPLIT